MPDRLNIPQSRDPIAAYKLQQAIDDLAAQAAPAPAAGGMTKIAQVVTTGSQASVAFNAIPQTFQDLYITYVGRDTSAAVSQNNLAMQINGDTATGNYQNNNQIGVLNATVLLNTPTATSFGIVIGVFPGSQIVANPLVVGDILIPRYAVASTWQKLALGRMTCQCTGSGSFTATRGGFWIHSGNPAITSIVFPAAATAFMDGTVFTLYGLG